MKRFIFVLLTLVLCFSVAACRQSSPNQSPEAVASPKIMKSQSDHRAYRYLTLDNAMKVLLISDTTSDKSAVAMVVSAGAYHAPRDREGLLHLLEHMLFLGTEKYPDVGEYYEFLKKSGAAWAANTGSEWTEYFFEVRHDAFLEALDRFAQFFTAPTLDPEYVKRERNSVDSEFRLNINDEFKRTHEACRRAMNPKHPHSMFSTGNLETLADRPGDMVYDDLLEAYQRHYSANRMSLVVLGQQSLDELEETVAELFGPVPNNGLDKPVLPTDFLAAEQLGTRVHIVPLREQRSVELTFPITDPSQYSYRKPTKIITHLLGHKGEHSLYQRLDQQGLIESLSAYVSDIEAFDALSIHMRLTPKGLQQVDEIVQEIFAYIDLIERDGVTEAYYNEIREIAALSFAYREIPNPRTAVTRLATALQNVEPAHVLSIDSLYEGFDAELTRSYLSQLRPSNMQMVLIAPGLATDQKEPRYDVDFSINTIPHAKLARWAGAKASDDMQLPGLNPLIAKDLQLKTSADGKGPELVFNEDGLKLWHYQDTGFAMPKSSFFMRIESPLAANSAAHRAMLALTRKLLDDELRGFGYAAEQAGLSYSILESDRGLGFGVEGYSDKQTQLIEAFNHAMTSHEVEAERFEMLKNSLLREWRNAEKNRPISQVYARMQREFGVDPFSEKELADALEPVSLEQFSDYVSALLSELNLKALVHGNTDRGEAIALAEALHGVYLKSAQPAPELERSQPRLTAAEERIVEIKIEHDDSAIVISYPAEESLRGLQQTMMLEQILAAPLLFELQTKQQLGYALGVFAEEFATTPALTFYIQSSVAGSKELARRIDQFVTDHFPIVEQMSDEDFGEHKAALLAEINQADGSLADRSQRLWQELEDGHLNFDKSERLAAEVSKMKKQDLIDAYRHLLLSDARRRMISRSLDQTTGPS